MLAPAAVCGRDRSQLQIGMGGKPHYILFLTLDFIGGPHQNGASVNHFEAVDGGRWPGWP